MKSVTVMYDIRVKYISAVKFIGDPHPTTFIDKKKSQIKILKISDDQVAITMLSARYRGLSRWKIREEKIWSLNLHQLSL